MGVVLGVASQYVPEIRKHTQEIGIQLSKNIEQYFTIDRLQDIVLKKRWKR